MTVLPWLLLPLTACLAAAGWWFDRRRSSIPGLLADRLRHRSIVTLKSGEAFGGVLFAADDQSVVLREAAALGAGDRGANVVVDGEVLILRGDISYIQLP